MTTTERKENGKKEQALSENLLCFENVYKNYGKTKALQGFSAVFRPGIHALLGPNGSGKSTLMNILTGNLRESSGKILFSGRDIRKLGGDFRKLIGFMPQYPGMYPSFTAEKFLWYMAALKGIPKATAAEQIPAVLREMELSDVAGRKISALSGGMKQRLAICQAVLGNPEILIFDEPTAGLDPKQRIVARNFISRIALRKIVIIATHVVQDVEYIAEEIILLKKGVIESTGSPAELVSKIAGKVWRLRTEAAQIPALQEKFRVTGISKSEDGIYLRILSEEQPDARAEAVSPTLEDYYLWIFDEETGVGDSDG